MEEKIEKKELGQEGKKEEYKQTAARTEEEWRRSRDLK